ncbi:MAG: biotin/lipoyl-containing protein [Rectinemataceae bacterium]|jgi:biotin carboxyl carrier protein
MKSYKISVNGQSYDVTVEEVGAANTAANAPAAPRAVPVRATGPAPVAVPAAQAPRSTAVTPSGATQVKAPMPGTLLSYKVAQGQAVKRGEVLLILEAMKMENEIVVPVDGVVAALCVSEGASVNTGDILVELAS